METDRVEHVVERLADLLVVLVRPRAWRRERIDRQTLAFRIGDAMQLTISAWREVAGNGSLDRSLAREFDDRRASGHAPTWKTVRGRRHLCWREDRELSWHVELTGAGDVVLRCAYAYDPQLLVGEHTARDVDRCLDEVSEMLATVAFAPAATQSAAPTLGN